MNVNSSFIHSSVRLEATQISLTRYMLKSWGVFIPTCLPKKDALLPQGALKMRSVRRVAKFLGVRMTI